MLSKSAPQTKKIARNFLDSLSNKKKIHATVLALSGDLGSGKTTFTKAVAAKLGIKETVASPTFVIMQIYRAKSARFKKLVHIDAYRLEKPGELLKLGWKDVVADPDNLILVEWAERVGRILPKDAQWLHFKFISDKTRRIKTVKSRNAKKR